MRTLSTWCNFVVVGFSVLLWSGIGLQFLVAQGQKAEVGPPDFPRAPGDSLVSPSTKTNAALKVVRPGVFQLGLIEFSKSERELRFEGEVNWKAGPIEYALVSDWGKVHESIFRTKAHPIHLHTAFVLMGVPVSSITNLALLVTEAEVAAGGTRGNPIKSKFPGIEMDVSVEWTEKGENDQEITTRLYSIHRNWSDENRSMDLHRIPARKRNLFGSDIWQSYYSNH